MSKKKEQVKFLKKKFASVVKAFEREKNKKKRNETFEFLTGRIAEFQQYKSGAADKGKAEQGDEAVTATREASGIRPSADVVDELRDSTHATQNLIREFTDRL